MFYAFEPVRTAFTTLLCAEKTGEPLLKTIVAPKQDTWLISCSPHTWSPVPQLVLLNFHGVMGSFRPEVEFWSYDVFVCQTALAIFTSLSFRRH